MTAGNSDWFIYNPHLGRAGNAGFRPAIFIEINPKIETSSLKGRKIG
jgi:hypothetical protein